MAVAKLPIYLVPEGFSHLSANIVEDAILVRIQRERQMAWIAQGACALLGAGRGGS
jgi:hypothetical protein